MQINHGEYWRMHNTLPPKGMCSGSRDLFKFWEISDNILEMVPDRGMVTLGN